MTYKAKIQNGTTTKVLKLGRCASVVDACERANQKCPKGFSVVDVYGVTK